MGGNQPPQRQPAPKKGLDSHDDGQVLLKSFFYFYFFNKNIEGEERRVKRKRKREDEGLEGLRYEEVWRERTKKKRMPLRQPVMQKSNKQRGRPKGSP